MKVINQSLCSRRNWYKTSTKSMFSNQQHCLRFCRHFPVAVDLQIDTDMDFILVTRDDTHQITRNLSLIFHINNHSCSHIDYRSVILVAIASR
uniref:BPTI/Kunitz inhibitor domain-containing protein n=1 Tax=Mesocestoides corti TaxID=53468 RepID=A0A5K3FW82_MESCO